MSVTSTAIAEFPQDSPVQVQFFDTDMYFSGVSAALTSANSVPLSADEYKTLEGIYNKDRRDKTETLIGCNAAVTIKGVKSDHDKLTAILVVADFSLDL